MNKPKQPIKKGLSDKELVAKYEGGSIDMHSALKSMAETPSNSSTLKKSKRK